MSEPSTAKVETSMARTVEKMTERLMAFSLSKIKRSWDDRVNATQGRGTSCERKGSPPPMKSPWAQVEGSAP